MVRKNPGQRVLLVVHAGLAVDEPGALHALGPGGARGILGVGLRLDGEAGDAVARSATGPRRSASAGRPAASHQPVSASPTTP